MQSKPYLVLISVLKQNKKLLMLLHLSDMLKNKWTDMPIFT